MNNINEKIKKLLSLASSDNKNEAEMALKKANELMIKFNIERNNLSYEERNYYREDINLGFKRPTHTIWVAQIIQRHFFVNCVLTRKRDSLSLAFLGEKENVENAIYIYNSLSLTFKGLGKGIRAKGSFYKGLADGFSYILTKQKMDTEKERGLVVVKDNGIDKFMKNEFGRTGTAKSNYGRSDSAYSNGYTQGKDIRINKSVTTNNQEKTRLLG